MSTKNNKSELLQGTLDMLILKCLVAGPRHGYGAALHRMLKHGWLSAEWGVSESNRKAKYYKLTRTGRAQLKREVGSWERMVSAIGMVLNANGSTVTQ